jgi:hypothetical protein
VRHYYGSAEKKPHWNFMKKWQESKQLSKDLGVNA